MATLNVKNLPDDLYESLRERASRNGRSIRGEVRCILEEALSASPRRPADLLAEVRAIRARYHAGRPGPSTEDLLADDRLR